MTPATSNSKDDSNSMTAHDRMNAINSRGKAKTGPPTQYREASKSRDACNGAGNSTQEANYSRGPINIRDDYSSMDNKNISKIVRSDIRKANNSREASNIQQDHQQQQKNSQLEH